MPRLTHDHYYLQMLSLVAARSTCPRRSVGAIIVDNRFQILSTGYNGVPSGFPHCSDGGIHACPGTQDAHGDTRRCLAVHAEVNALLQCKRMDLAHTIYVSCTPCFECAKALCNTTIKRVVCLEEYTGTGLDILRAKGLEIWVREELTGSVLMRVDGDLSSPPRWCDDSCRGRLNKDGMCVRCGFTHKV